MQSTRKKKDKEMLKPTTMIDIQKEKVCNILLEKNQELLRELANVSYTLPMNEYSEVSDKIIQTIMFNIERAEAINETIDFKLNIPKVTLDEVRKVKANRDLTAGEFVKPRDIIKEPEEIPERPKFNIDLSNIKEKAKDHVEKCKQAENNRMYTKDIIEIINNTAFLSVDVNVDNVATIKEIFKKKASKAPLIIQDFDRKAELQSSLSVVVKNHGGKVILKTKKEFADFIYKHFNINNGIHYYN